MPSLPKVSIGYIGGKECHSKGVKMVCQALLTRIQLERADIERCEAMRLASSGTSNADMGQWLGRKVDARV